MRSFVFLVCFGLICFLNSCAILFGVKNPVNKNPQNNEETQTKENIIINNKITCYNKVLDNGPNLRIFLQLEITRLSNVDGRNALMNEYDFNYGLMNDYNSQEFIKTGRIVLEQSSIQKIGDRYYIFFDIVKESMPRALLLVEIIDKKTTQKLVHDVPLNFVSTNMRNFYAFFNDKGSAPYFTNYISVKDTVQIKGVARSADRIYIKHFPKQFPAAATPMTLSAQNQLLNLSPDTVFEASTSMNLVLDKEGFYEIKEDDKSYYGLSIFVTKNRYPKLANIKDLIDPLTYITTQEEITKLRNAATTKPELDRLWLKLMSGNVSKAKQTIKTYYNRVRIANEYFTTYKEGWKTDMGMIYIVFGTPSKVRRFEDREIWTYSQSSNFSEINFTFMRKPNQFVDDEYILVRYAEYEQVWYPAIELWRSGQVGG